jgi:hypothetical protein
LSEEGRERGTLLGRGYSLVFGLLSWYCIDYDIKERMATNLRVEDRLEGSGNFRSWKHRLQMILDENDLLEHVTVGVLEPEEEEKKTKHKKNEKKAKRIVSD